MLAAMTMGLGPAICRKLASSEPLRSNTSTMQSTTADDSLMPCDGGRAGAGWGGVGCFSRRHRALSLYNTRIAHLQEVLEALRREQLVLRPARAKALLDWGEREERERLRWE